MSKSDVQMELILQQDTRCCYTTDFSEHHHKTNKSVSNVVKFKRDCSQIEGRSSQYLKHFLQSSVYAACQKLSHKK